MTMEYLRIPLENTADFGYSLFFGCRCSSTENFFKVLVDNFRILGWGNNSDCKTYGLSLYLLKYFTNQIYRLVLFVVKSFTYQIYQC